MNLYVWNYDFTTSKFHKVEIIDNATSIIWVTRFNQCGEFELYLSASEHLIELFSGETIITRDDSDVIMWVEKIELTTDVENGDHLTISGRSAECVLGRRIVNKQTILKGTAETAIRQLLGDNVINPVDTIRKIDFIKYGTLNNWATDTIKKQITGTDVLTAISEICETYNYGFKMTMNAAGEMVFDLYKGVDRSYNQTENTFVVFSPEFENLAKTNYSRNDAKVSNYVYVAGEGEGTARKIRSVHNIDETGLGIRETWVDARNISSNSGAISDAEYNAMLDAKGHEQIEKLRPVVTFGGEIINVNGYVYKVDYNIGDTVSIKNEYGVTGRATITEITEVEDDAGHKLVPTLSEWSV